MKILIVVFGVLLAMQNAQAICEETQANGIRQTLTNCSGNYCNPNGIGGLIYSGFVHNIGNINYVECRGYYCDRPGYTSSWGGYSVCDSNYDSGAESSVQPVSRPVRTCGSIVQFENQVLGETVPIVGAGFNMNYFSSWLNSKRFKAKVPIAGTAVRSGINSFDIRVEDSLGNIIHTDSFLNNQTNYTYDFVWDGLDSLGNPTHEARIFEFIVTENRNGFSLPIRSKVTLGGFGSQPLGLGGWLPSVFKYFDKNSKRLYSGDGSIEIKSTFGIWNTTGSMLVEEDGSLIHYFDQTGKILYTKTGLTNATVYAFNYDGSGRLTSIDESFDRTTSFNRNGSGDFVSITAPKGQITQITLDGNGLVASMTNPNSEVYTMTYHGTTGLLHTFQKPEGQVSTFTYNSDGKLTRDAHSGGYFFDLVKNLSSTQHDYSVVSKMGKVSRSYGTETATNVSRNYVKDGLSGTFSYSDFGSSSSNSNNYASILWYESLVAHPRFGNLARRKNEVSVTYSDSPQLTKSYAQNITLSNPNDPFSISSWTFTQKTNGNNSTLVSGSYNPTLKKFSLSTAVGKTAELSIDSYERPISVKQGNLDAINYSYINENLTSVTQGTRTTQLGYDSLTGWLTSVTNPLSQTTSFAYNNAGRLTSVTLPDSRVFGITQDGNGNITGLTPPGRPLHQFAFNASELVSSYSPPTLSGVSVVNTTYEYDNDKFLKKIIKPTGAIIELVRNASTGIVQSMITPAGNISLSPHWSFGKPTYITLPAGINTNISYVGPLIKGTSFVFTANGSQVFGYDRTFSTAGLLTTTDTVSIAGNTSQISYAYNGDFDMTTAGSLTLTYGTPNGQLTGTSLGSSPAVITDSYTYNSYGEVTGYEAKYDTTTIYSYTLARDGMGRVDEKTQSMNGVTNTFAYTFDSAGRLTEAEKNSVVVATYEYDSNSNRNGGTIGAQATSASYDDQDRVLTYNTLSFTHNADGELLSKTNNTLSQTTSYVYDVFGNLTQVTLPGGAVITYDIDGLNRRVGKRINGVVQKRWIYMDQLRIAAEIDGSGNILKRFIYAAKKNIPDYMIAAGQSYRIISDHLGSPRLVVKLSDGSVIQRMDHDEFGRVTEDTNPGYLPFGFAGGLYDGETGLVRFGARDYDPEIGRWTSKDPILFAGRQTNLYGYTFNDPINFIDPTGTVGLGGAIIGGVVGGVSGYLTGISTGANPAQAALAGAAIGAASGFTGAYLIEGAAALGVGTAGQIFAGSFGAFQTGFVGSLLSQQISGQRPSVGDAAKQGGMCAVGAGGGAALGLGYSSGAQMAIDGAFGASLIPVDLLLAR